MLDVTRLAKFNAMQGSYVRLVHFGGVRVESRAPAAPPCKKRHLMAEVPVS
jgi:hypothetical protein